MGRGASAAFSGMKHHPAGMPGEGPDSVPGVQLPWRPRGLSQVPVMLPYLPTTWLQAGHPPTRSRPGAVIRRWYRTTRISLCGAGRKLIRKMTGTITVPAIPLSSLNSSLWLYYNSLCADAQEIGLDVFRHHAV